MRLNSIDFGPCLVMSGTQGFFGRGYSFHRNPLMRDWLNDFRGATFVAKTTTAYRQQGNTPFRGDNKDYEPTEFRPKSIWVSPWSWWHGLMLNAVGLSGPGCEDLFLQYKWQARDQPFMISFMPVGKTRDEKIAETKFFAEQWKIRMPKQSPAGLQLNISCPNVKADFSELIKDAGDYLDMLGELGVPIMVKINVLMTPKAAVELSQHLHCAGLCVSNTVPFGQLPDVIPWDRWFPSGSPLADLGGGGLSGAPLFPILCQWLAEAFDAGLEKPVNAGGGILHWRDVDDLVTVGLRHGIDSIAFGSVAILRPWRVRSIISRAHALLT